MRIHVVKITGTFRLSLDLYTASTVASFRYQTLKIVDKTRSFGFRRMVETGCCNKACCMVPICFWAQFFLFKIEKFDSGENTDVKFGIYEEQVSEVTYQ